MKLVLLTTRGSLSHSLGPRVRCLMFGSLFGSLVGPHKSTLEGLGKFSGSPIPLQVRNIP